MADFYGIAGLFLILFGWSVELLRAWRSGKAQVPLMFAILYGAGSLLLMLHSFILDDLAFIGLNAAAALIAGANVWLSLRAKGAGK